MCARTRTSTTSNNDRSALLWCGEQHRSDHDSRDVVPEVESQRQDRKRDCLESRRCGHHSGRRAKCPCGLGGRPLARHRSSATAKASWTASSATSMSPKRRASTATAHPYSLRNIRSISLAATLGVSVLNPRLHLARASPRWEEWWPARASNPTRAPRPGRLPDDGETAAGP